MNWQSVWQFAKSDYLKLVPILALAFYMAFIPNQNYPYPVHIDEWVHMTYSKAMLQAGDVTFIDPFLGQSTVSLSSNLEAGFHLFWGVFQSISGISWLTIFRYFPSVIFMLTVLSVYVLARREGFGWEAALFALLIPTTVGIMGPAFLVPVAMGLLFVPLSLFIAFNCRTARSYLVLFVFTLFLMSIHAPSAISSVMVLVPYIFLNLKSNPRHSLAIVLAIAVPFLLTLPWTSGLILSTAKSLFIPQPPIELHDLPRIIKTYGSLPILSALLGTALLAIRGNKRDYGLALGLLVLLLMLATFYTLHYGVGMMYLRGMLFMMLMLSIVAGAGLMGVKRFRLPERISLRLKVPLLTQNVGRILCLVLVGFILATTIPSRQNTPYYHMIDEADYKAFVWISDNIGEDYQKAIVDPWKATAFSAITGKYVYTRTHMATSARDREAYTFLANGSANSTFLKENGISVIYTRVYNLAQNTTTEYSSDNPDLIQVAKNVYLLKN